MTLFGCDKKHEHGKKSTSFFIFKYTLFTKRNKKNYK